ncbi:ABC transporter ATP-binding protein [bacterium]|nr:ABC transporter ATP-binding protein [bacterium]
MKIALNSLAKKFFSLRKDHYAVKNLSLEINDKDFFVLLGPSGCGKSTTLNLMAGLEKPTSGEISFNDKIVASPAKKIFLSPKERNIAMVFQNYALYPHLNTFDNIAFPLKILKMNKTDIKKSVEQTADILKLSHLLKSKPNELSGGERQRVAIARAIVRKPDLFLLDEPLSNLDARLRTSTRAELKKLQRRLNVTTVYVTHDQVEAMTLADKIAVMNNGKIEQVGTPDELYDNPANIFTASFIGNPPMNIFKTKIMEQNNSFFIQIGNTKLKLGSVAK